MKLLDSIVALVSALAWPVAAVVVAVLFRKEVRSLVGRIKSLKWKDAEADLTEASNTVLEIETQSNDEDEAKAAAAMLKVRRESRGRPAELVEDSWLLVVKTLNDTMITLDRSWHEMRPTASGAAIVLRDLARKETIPKTWTESIEGLFALYCGVIRDGDMPAPSQATLFAITCQQLVVDLLRARDNR